MAPHYDFDLGTWVDDDGTAVTTQTNQPNTNRDWQQTAEGKSLADQIRAAYRNYLGRDATDADVASKLDWDQMPDRTFLSKILVEIYNSDEAVRHRGGATTATTTTTKNTGGGGGGTGGTTTNDWGGMNDVPVAPDYSFMTDAPAFNAPGFSYERFTAPGAEDVLADPGYQFRMNQGAQALQQSAAARGVLRTGGTMKDILGYGQSLASQEYGNVYARKATEYQGNFNNALSAYQQNYNAAKDAYAPQNQTWSTQQDMLQRRADLGWGRAWDRYTYSHPSATSVLNHPLAS